MVGAIYTTPTTYTNTEGLYGASSPPSTYWKWDSPNYSTPGMAQAAPFTNNLLYPEDRAMPNHSRRLRQPNTDSNGTDQPNRSTEPQTACLQAEYGHAPTDSTSTHARDCFHPFKYTHPVGSHAGYRNNVNNNNNTPRHANTESQSRGSNYKYVHPNVHHRMHTSHGYST